MDVELRCNNTRCRKPLGNADNPRACVTTCSHIFCIDCADGAFGISLLCPSCQTSLTSKSDIVLAELNPPEDYKSSVLAGLRPDIIADVCQRALSFWTYQVAQELAYQEAVQKMQESQRNRMEEQASVAITQANSELGRKSSRGPAL
ncbi:hypothetical protein THASP1DRAFT_32223 [Thamnocephalis sphaerospora]|uniref:RING-type domain-containing protein n=1 Tax=Thamnocephalis sphaerospora TaxID=78915 RepID=A0A4P9XJM0_9FUNG|nr:hypothetical protein THASP1DRAFT_32223 [Thamnocephalis sphaerospora]|eukprot:RKP05952.1 hypothetical protein THASP1DRAFT_32223 [Thamnocephalis sphaerospora]